VCGYGGGCCGTLLAKPAACGSSRSLPFPHPDAAHLNEFVKANQNRLARNVDGNYAYLADTGVNPRLAMGRWPKMQFHATREHGQQLV